MINFYQQVSAPSSSGDASVQSQLDLLYKKMSQVFKNTNFSVRLLYAQIFTTIFSNGFFANNIVILSG